VLVLALGTAARLLPLIRDARKRYVFELIVGARTDTGDASGAVLERAQPREGWSAALEGAARELTGPIDQTPPMHSARKIGGLPLYRLARKGRSVDRAPRRVTIHQLSVLGSRGSSARLEVECDAGTYVRTLCEQIGERIGVLAHMGALVRTAAGPFRIAQSKLPVEIERDPAACVVDPLAVLAQRRIGLSAREFAAFVHGNEVALDTRAASLERCDEGPTLATLDGRIVGIGRIRLDEAGCWLRPTRVLARE